MSVTSKTSNASAIDCPYGEKCSNFECPRTHPKTRTKKCQEAALCINFDCSLLHPFSRAKKCPNADTCTLYFCRKLHPKSRTALCPEQEVCNDAGCNLLHPNERPKSCRFGSNCYKENCRFLQTSVKNLNANQYIPQAERSCVLSLVRIMNANSCILKIGILKQMKRKMQPKRVLEPRKKEMSSD